MLLRRAQDLHGLNQDELRTLLQSDREGLRLIIDGLSLYSAGCRVDLAAEWLSVWYAGERLAAVCEKAEAEPRELEGGQSEVEFVLYGCDVELAAKELAALLPAFNPDDGESRVFFLEEATDWVEPPGPLNIKFPELRDEYLLEEEPAQRERDAEYDDDAD